MPSFRAGDFVQPPPRRDGQCYDVIVHVATKSSVSSRATSNRWRDLFIRIFFRSFRSQIFVGCRCVGPGNGRPRNTWKTSRLVGDVGRRRPPPDGSKMTGPTDERKKIYTKQKKNENKTQTTAGVSGGDRIREFRWPTIELCVCVSSVPLPIGPSTKFSGKAGTIGYNESRCSTLP